MDIFCKFWDMYPKKVARVSCVKLWMKLKREEMDLIIGVLPNHCDQESWIKDGGKFIPNPSTWLNQRRWEDEIKVSSKGNLLGNKTFTI